MRPARLSFLFLGLVVLGGVLADCGCGRSQPVQRDDASAPRPIEWARLSEYSTEELLAYLTLEYVNWHYEHTGEAEARWEIQDELSTRADDLPLLLEAFAHPVDAFQQKSVAEVVRRFDDPAVLAAFEKHPTDGEDRVAWYCLQYRAERDDTEALRILNEHYGDYPVSSAEWAETAALFGEFGYRPAIPNLIESLDAASLNLAGAACVSLEKLFPGPHPDLEGPSAAKRYFETLYEAAGE